MANPVKPFARLLVSTFLHLGTPGTYRRADGAEVVTRFIAKTPDVVESFGDTRLVVATHRFDVMVRDVADPLMPNAALSEAIKEAYASAPSQQIILHTLELRHPAFVDDAGQPVAIRVVRDTGDLWARLESQAPLQAGERVQFVAMGFELDLPPVDTMPVPEITVTLDNASREIVRHLDAAAESQSVIEVTYRPYLSTDLEGPQMDPPIHLVLTEVEADIFRVTGRARMLDVGNKAFPGISYTAKTFPGLTR